MKKAISIDKAGKLIEHSYKEDPAEVECWMFEENDNLMKFASRCFAILKNDESEEVHIIGSPNLLEKKDDSYWFFGSADNSDTEEGLQSFLEKLKGLKSLEQLNDLENLLRKRLEANPNSFLPAIEFTIPRRFSELRETLTSESSLELLNNLEEKVHNWLETRPNDSWNWAKFEAEVLEQIEKLKIIHM